MWKEERMQHVTELCPAQQNYRHICKCLKCQDMQTSIQCLLQNTLVDQTVLTALDQVSLCTQTNIRETCNYIHSGVYYNLFMAREALGPESYVYSTHLAIYIYI